MDDVKLEKINKRVEKWLLNPNARLDLSNLGLKSWPTILNHHLDKIIELDCSSNQLTALPALPQCIRLYCHHNQLTALSSLARCTGLDCSNNQLTALPALSQCTRLYCYNNQLTALPALPRCTNLWCFENQLTALPALPMSMFTYLRCAGNQLFSNNLLRWRKVWRWRLARQLIRFRTRLFRIVRVLRLRLYLPRKNELHTELHYSPYHPGKFYLNDRKSDQWYDEVD